MDKRYLIEYYPGTMNAEYDKYVKNAVLNESQLFGLLQKQHNDDLPESNKVFTVSEIGKTLLDFS